MVGGRHVLVVEDEAAFRSLLVLYLQKRGAEVSVAGSLAEAEQLLDVVDFDSVVLDVGLPDGDGLTLFDRLPAERSLVISANPDPERFARRGVLHFLAKPLDLREFAHQVEKLSAEAPG